MIFKNIKGSPQHYTRLETYSGVFSKCLMKPHWPFSFSLPFLFHMETLPLHIVKYRLFEPAWFTIPSQLNSIVFDDNICISAMLLLARICSEILGVSPGYGIFLGGEDVMMEKAIFSLLHRVHSLTRESHEQCLLYARIWHFHLSHTLKLISISWLISKWKTT